MFPKHREFKNNLTIFLKLGNDLEKAARLMKEGKTEESNREYKKIRGELERKPNKSDYDLYTLAKFEFLGLGGEKNQEAAMKKFKYLADKDEVKYDADYIYAQALYFGEGVEENREEAFRYYEKAANRGNLDAKFDCAVMLENGFGIKKDPEKAVKYYEELAERNRLDALNNLAAICAAGDIVEQDVGRAIDLFQRIINNSEEIDPIYEYNLGLMKFIAGNKEEAVKYFENAASKKDGTDGRYCYGTCLYEGVGVEKDKTRGLKLIKQAAEEGSLGALVYLYNNKLYDEKGSLRKEYIERAIIKANNIEKYDREDVSIDANDSSIDFLKTQTPSNFASAIAKEYNEKVEKLHNKVREGLGDNKIIFEKQDNKESNKAVNTTTESSSIKESNTENIEEDEKTDGEFIEIAKTEEITGEEITGEEITNDEKETQKGDELNLDSSFSVDTEDFTETETNHTIETDLELVKYNDTNDFKTDEKVNFEEGISETNPIKTFNIEEFKKCLKDDKEEIKKNNEEFNFNKNENDFNKARIDGKKGNNKLEGNKAENDELLSEKMSKEDEEKYKDLLFKLALIQRNMDTAKANRNSKRVKKWEDRKMEILKGFSSGTGKCLSIVAKSLTDERTSVDEKNIQDAIESLNDYSQRQKSQTSKLY